MHLSLSILLSFFFFCSIANTAFSSPLPPPGFPIEGLSPAQLAAFKRGRLFFQKPFRESEGLGPAFNDTSCLACHRNPVPGGSHLGANSGGVQRFCQSNANGCDTLPSQGGPLLQPSGIQVGSNYCGESWPAVDVLENRRPQSLLGAGFLEYIALQDLQSGSGILRLVSSLSNPNATPAPGLFGWQGQLPKLLDFNADALTAEMGITNSVVATEHAPNGNQSLLSACDQVADPEDSVQDSALFFINEYSRLLSPPPQTPESGHPGEALFNQIGCNSCHRREYQIPNSKAVPAEYRGALIKPYSDFRVHNMGDNGPRVPEGSLSQGWVRTPSLWGFLYKDCNWHDGSACGVQAAIQRHSAPGSEANSVAAAYANLSTSQQNTLHEFLLSLGRVLFDDHSSAFIPDHQVNNDDFSLFASCFGSSAVGPCLYTDANGDHNVDRADLAVFEKFYRPWSKDCDGNGIQDVREIVLSQAPANSRGELDTCHVDLTLDTSWTLPSWTSNFDLSVRGNPGEVIYLFVSLSHSYENTCFRPGLCVNLEKAKPIGVFTANPQGYVHWSMNVPEGILEAASFQALSVRTYPKGPALTRSRVIRVDIVH